MNIEKRRLSNFPLGKIENHHLREKLSKELLTIPQAPLLTTTIKTQTTGKQNVFPSCARCTRQQHKNFYNQNPNYHPHKKTPKNPQNSKSKAIQPFSSNPEPKPPKNQQNQHKNQAKQKKHHNKNQKNSKISHPKHHNKNQKNSKISHPKHQNQTQTLGKERITITLDKELLKWLDKKIEQKIFANRSHGFEYLIMQNKKKDIT